MAIQQAELTPTEDAIVRTLYELVSNVSGAEVKTIKAHMETRFPWLDVNRAAVEPVAEPVAQETAPSQARSEE